MRTGIYNISCDYIIGCNYSGCSYELSSTNRYINGSIMGENYEVVSVDVNTQYNLTVTDINGDVVFSQEIISLDAVCTTTTGNAIYWDYNFLYEFCCAPILMQSQLVMIMSQHLKRIQPTT